MSNCVFEYTGKQNTRGRFVQRCLVCLQEVASKDEDSTLKATCPGSPENVRMVRIPGKPFGAFKPGTTPRYLMAYFPKEVLVDDGSYVLLQTEPSETECVWSSHRDFGVSVTVTLAGMVTVTSPAGTFTGQAPVPWDGTPAPDEAPMPYGGVILGNGVYVHTADCQELVLV